MKSHQAKKKQGTLACCNPSCSLGGRIQFVAHVCCSFQVNNRCLHVPARWMLNTCSQRSPISHHRALLLSSQSAAGWSCFYNSALTSFLSYISDREISEGHFTFLWLEYLLSQCSYPNHNFKEKQPQVLKVRAQTHTGICLAAWWS